MPMLDPFDPRSFQGATPFDPALYGARVGMLAPGYVPPADETALPMNATSTGGPALDIAPPSPAVPDSSLLGRLGNVFGRIGDAISTHPTTLLALGGGLAGAPSLGVGLSRGFTAAAPALNLDQRLQMQRSAVSATYGTILDQLVKNGMPPAQAAQRALMMATNPEMAKALLPQTFGPEKPEVTNITTPDGISHQAAYDPVTRQYKDIISGQPLGVSIGGGASGIGASAPATGVGAPAAAAPPTAPASPAATPANPFGAPVISAQPGISPPLAPPPAGANVPEWIQAQTAGAAKESTEAAEKAQGGFESLQKINELRKLAQDAPEDAFGKLRGTGPYQYLNAFGGAFGMRGGIGENPNVKASDLLDWHERLNAAYGRLALPKAKEYFGTARTPELINKAAETIGSTSVSSKETALNILEDESAKSHAAIADGIRRGKVDPAQLADGIKQGYIDPAKLFPKVKTPAESRALGPGAFFLDPDNNVHRNPMQ